jgi:glycosyltransferase involved in cell wall biosynthesis
MEAPVPLLRPQALGLRLLVCIPALDEERTVGDVVRRVPRTIPGVAEVDILVIDDGSRDATSRQALDAGARVLRHRATRGVGAAFHSALSEGIETGADLVVSIDADGQLDPADIPALVAPVVEGRADFTSASRFLDPALTPEMPRLKRLGNRVLSRLISRLAGQTFHDVSCGMRCYGRDAAAQLHLLGRFTYTQEVFLNLAFKQLRIEEVPLRVRGEREFGESRVAHDLWRYALRAARIIFRCYRDYHPLRFFGAISAAFAVSGLLLGAFLGIHYASTGAFTPHKWAGFAASVLLGLAILSLHTGIVGDMLTRHRIYLEELLYRDRNRTSGRRAG